jgi:poly-gamma-glutamate synthesis protein (capsule biosynthesis protein)
MNSICFLGDVWLPKPVSVKVAFPGPVVFNLESPITTGRLARRGKVNLKAERNHIVSAFGRPPLAVCLANNHAMDYCAEGLEETVAALDADGIRHFGAGGLGENCTNPLLLSVGGVQVALLGYVSASTNPVFAEEGLPGVMPIDPRRIADDMAAARQAGADRIIVNLHWGEEEVYLPKSDDVRVARAIVDAGADLILGHHAHRIQPFEIYQGKHIFYGLGNAIFFSSREVPMPANIDERGNPTHVYRLRQVPWNRYSLCVCYDPGEASISISRLYFSQGTLAESPCAVSDYQFQPQDYRNYERAFRRSYLWGKWRRPMRDFFLRPKLPRWRHVAAVLNSLRGHRLA